MMKLRDFIDKYGFFYENDFELIIKWIENNGYQKEMIQLITKLTESLVAEHKQYKSRSKEWSSYAMSILPEITEETDFTTCINAIRLIYMGYRGSQFRELCDNVMKSKYIDWEIVKSMHPYIYEAYFEELEQW